MPGWAVRLLLALIVGSLGHAALAQPLAPRPPSLKPAKSVVTRFDKSDVVYVKFLDDLNLTATNGVLTDVSGRALNAAARALVANRGGSRWDGLHGIAAARLHQLRQSAQHTLRKAVADLRGEFHYTLPAGTDAAAAIDAFNRLDCVEIALPVPMPVAPPLPPDYRMFQGYLNSATVGIGAEAMWSGPYYANGSRVRMADVEYSWNFNHQDYATPQLVGPPPVDPFNDINHGTAVVGQLSSYPNGWGTVGAAFGCGSVYVAAANTANGYSVAAAILQATSVMAQGDVLIIEQQTIGPNYTGSPPGTQFGLVAAEWYQPTYNAIVTAVGNGIIVVEAAGNGSQNLDDPVYQTGNGGHWPFLPQNDSGAIIVGGGAAPGSPRGDRSRLGFSCYGSTVDLQGWGEGVVTTGYGNAYASEGENLYYTNTFSGTSSATPIVAAACALLEDFHEGYTFGATLTPAQVRSLLRDTGSPQLNGDYPSWQQIGPRPNVVAAADLIMNTDTTPPQPDPMYFDSSPVALSTSEIAMTAVQANDSQSPPVEYAFIAEPSDGGHDSGWIFNRTHVDTGLNPNTRYGYRVKARDSAATPNETQLSALAAHAVTFIENPYGVSFSSVTENAMTVTADGFFTNLYSDSSGLYFEVDPPVSWPANSWAQTTSIYLTGLSPGTAYTVRVKSRNRDGVEGPFTAPYTQATSGGSQTDITAPFPNPMYFSMNPMPLSESQVYMSAAIAFDFESPPVQYYFQNASSPGHDSGWIDSTFFTDNQLPANSDIYYRVRARDSAPIPNETLPSFDVAATTFIETPTDIAFTGVADTFLMLSITNTLSHLYAGQSAVYIEMQPDVPGSGANLWTQNTYHTFSNLTPGTQYTFRAKARNRHGIETPFSDYFFQSTTGMVDHTPPSPDPMQFDMLPTPLSTSAIAMSAVVATDLQHPMVQYYFQNLYAFGHDSNWISSMDYTDFNLQPNTDYTYRVRARDGAPQPNETQPSPEATTATFIETPTGLQFHSVSDNTVSLSAMGYFSNLYAGQSGLFLEMSPDVPGSGANQWTQSTPFYLIGLSPGTTYTFRVKARNRNGIETEYSSTFMQSTTGSRRGDCDGNGIVQPDLDTTCFIGLLLEYDMDPLRLSRCDMNHDGVVDGGDIESFAQCMIEGCP